MCENKYMGQFNYARLMTWVIKKFENVDKKTNFVDKQHNLNA